ncbi:putative non-LTR retroelement reverse transcriptase [Senna tora]|uniref:Putative non-LTR retroelement reverse transcriptase n=1 Tax=Senna tora TaxID=362788 RepID=A0A834SP71_9FABA|nr:putative non-LTR retroelement reverse transcriptase [Senna tora]
MRHRSKMAMESVVKIYTEVHNYKEAAMMDRRVNSLQNPSAGNPMTWQPPDEGWYKINCDGSYWCNSDDISCGGVIRNSHGDWITGFAKKLGKGTVFQAELWGALIGLKTAWDLHLPSVILETDSTLVYNFITKGCSDSSPVVNMARSFKDLLAKDWMVHIKHVHRDSNLLADILAISAHFNSFGLVSFDRVPDFCKATFLDDHNRVLASFRLGS